MVPSRSRTNHSSQSPGAYSFGPAQRSLRVGPRAVSGPVSKAVPIRVAQRRSVLADDVAQHLAKRRYAGALTSILRLVMLDPTEPRWHQKYGEVLRTLGRNREAAAAYRRAARRYDALALPARASAALRVAESLEGASAATPTVPIGSDRNPTQAALPPEECVTLRPPWK